MLESATVMDPLSDVLALLKPLSFGFRGLDAAGDWSLTFDAVEDVKVFAIERGSCGLSVPACGIEMTVGAGDVILLFGGTAYTLFSAPGVEAKDANLVFETFGVGTTGTLNGGGDCMGIGGFFNFSASYAGLLLDVLPPLIHVTAEATRSKLGWLIRHLMDELREPQLGGALVAGHLAQTLLVEAIRLHLTGSVRNAGWLAALADRHLRAAVTAMHAEPDRRWSLVDLARTAGLSRSSFAERFRRVVGEAPLEYLTRWRMLLTAAMLADGHVTLAAIAPKVGYESENALGVAFKRVMGRSPRAFVRGERPTIRDMPDQDLAGRSR